MRYPATKFGEFLSQRKQFIQIEDTEKYKRARVQLHWRGIVLRDEVEGALIKTKKQQVARRDELLVAEIDAKVGGVGIVPAELDRAIVSSHYFLFEINELKCLRQWLDWFVRSGGLEDQFVARGSTNYAAIRPHHILNCEIPLPTLDDQRRIVSRIEELAPKVKAAMALRQQGADDVRALFASVLSRACTGDLTSKWRRENATVEPFRESLDRISNHAWQGHALSRKRTPINLPPRPAVPQSWIVLEAGELQERGAILDIQDGNHGGDYPRKIEFGTEGVPFVTAKQMKDGTVHIATAPRLPSDRAERLRIGFARAGDVLLTHNASVGGVAVAPANSGDFLIGTSVTYWRCNPDALDARYLFYFMQSGHFQGQLQFIMKQTTRNQVSVLKQVSLWICVPPLPEQRYIVACLENLQSNVDALKELQSETDAELEALMPSILSKAFSGEL